MKSLSKIVVLLLVSATATAEPDHELKSLLCESYSDSLTSVLQQEAKDQEGFVAMMTSMMSLAFKSALNADTQRAKDNRMVISANVAGLVAGLNYSSSRNNFEPISDSHANQAKQRLIEDCISNYGNYGPQIKFTDSTLRKM